MSNTEFFLVWREGGGGQSPRVRHETEALANKEAVRLASQEPGVRFVVLKSTSAALVEKPVPVVTRYERDFTYVDWAKSMRPDRTDAFRYLRSAW